MTGPSPIVHCAVRDAVATITLDDGVRRNALSAELVDALSARLTEAVADESVRAIVLAHTGTVFCAGADLREQTAPGGPARGTARLVALLRTIVELPLPVLARVDGAVRAGGVGLVGACDLAFASDTSSFAFTEVRLGLAPAVVSLTSLSRMTPRAASRYALTGEVFTAPAAVVAGLLTASAADGDELDGALELVLGDLRRTSRQGLAETKKLTTRSVRASFAADAESLTALSAQLFASPEAQQRMAAFLSRSRPAGD